MLEGTEEINNIYFLLTNYYLVFFLQMMDESFRTEPIHLQMIGPVTLQVCALKNDSFRKSRQTDCEYNVFNFIKYHVFARSK